MAEKSTAVVGRARICGMSDHHYDHDCGCDKLTKEQRKRAKQTHVAGANCCSSYANVYTKCKRKRCC